MTIETLYALFEKHPVITTDSRDCPPGSIFFALKGANFNGNGFAHKALEQGCAYAVIDEAAFLKEGDARYILVDNVLATLQQLANKHRRVLGTKVIAITGTNGKTTTKEFTAAVLAQKYNVLYTIGNLNNDIGVPKTLLRLTSKHEVAVIEMGASHPGDIKVLAEMAEPDYALITNVGRAHLQGFGSFEGVMRTKAELYDFMAAHRRCEKIFVNAANDYLLQMFATHCGAQTPIAYAANEAVSAQYHAKLLANNPFVQFAWQETGESKDTWHRVQTHLIGAYNIDNMLAAVSIGRTFGVDADAVCQALEGYIPGNNRSQLIVTAHNRLVMDAYNANPTSMQAALENFKNMEADKKMVILGDMKELGEVSRREHQKVVELLGKAAFDKVWLVGDEFLQAQCSFMKFKNTEEVVAHLQQESIEGYTVLIKGSNSVRLSALEKEL